MKQFLFFWAVCSCITCTSVGTQDSDIPYLKERIEIDMKEFRFIEDPIIHDDYLIIMITEFATQ